MKQPIASMTNRELYTEWEKQSKDERHYMILQEIVRYILTIHWNVEAHQPGLGDAEDLREAVELVLLRFVLAGEVVADRALVDPCQADEIRLFQSARFDGLPEAFAELFHHDVSFPSVSFLIPIICERFAKIKTFSKKVLNISK